MSGSHGHSHGSLSKLLHIPGKIYHATVSPFYVWLGNKLGGRAKSGRNARYGRIGRVLANILSLSFIAAVIALKGWTVFWTGGAALPLWALLGVGAGIALNSAGWLVSAAANHLKIEQYYDAEMELHAENDELMAKTTKLTGRGRKIAMNSARLLHDINSYTGTALGIAAGIPETLALISVATYAFNPALGATLFLVSRVSALASVICIWGTNQFRLWAYKKSLKDEMQIYAQCKKSGPDSGKFNIIEDIVNKALTGLSISPDKNYTAWVKFRCVKALEGAWVGGKIDAISIQIELENMLKPFLDSQGEFSREKLMGINGPDAPKVSVLDSMLILESRLFDKLSEFMNGEKHQANNLDADPLLSYHLKRELLKEENPAGKIEALKQSVKPAPVSVKTAHGSVYLPYYGARKMAGELITMSQVQIAPAHTLHEIHDRENLVL